MNVFENEIGDIVLNNYRKDKINPQNKIVTIKVDGKKPEILHFEILNAYLKDYRTIILEGAEVGKLYNKMIMEMKAFIGLDIIERTKGSIVIKNFSSEDKELSPRSLIKKIDLGIREMFDMISKFFESGFSKDDFFELQKVKEQNERIYSLIRKVILNGIENPSLMRQLQTTYHQLTKDKVVVGILNNISSLLESVGKTILYLEHTRKDATSLKKIFKLVEKEYRLVISTMRYKNYSDIFQSISEHNETISRMESHFKRFENPLVLETMTYILVIKDSLNWLAFEIIE